MMLKSSRRVEQPAMFQDGIAVGHAGDVVGHRARPAGGPVIEFQPRAVALCSSGISAGSLKNASNSSVMTRRALEVMRCTL